MYQGLGVMTNFPPISHLDVAVRVSAQPDANLNPRDFSSRVIFGITDLARPSCLGSAVNE